MTTGECCHLPGSLCDCSGSPSFSKIVEATGLGPPQYVAQVTSRDGRLLSTVIRALDGPRLALTNLNQDRCQSSSLCVRKIVAELTSVPVSLYFICGTPPQRGLTSGARSTPGIRTCEPRAAEREHANLTIVPPGQPLNHG
uniref:Membrane associated ring-CH-type finger 2 n=1 Tax=Equus caballus TaxID=9796 RepID=A0A9L0RMZ8_HORSE